MQSSNKYIYITYTYIHTWYYTHIVYVYMYTYTFCTHFVRSRVTSSGERHAIRLPNPRSKKLRKELKTMATAVTCALNNPQLTPQSKVDKWGLCATSYVYFRCFDFSYTFVRRKSFFKTKVKVEKKEEKRGKEWQERGEIMDNWNRGHIYILYV